MNYAMPTVDSCKRASCGLLGPQTMCVMFTQARVKVLPHKSFHSTWQLVHIPWFYHTSVYICRASYG